jgi:signal transduction histidine kinase/integral membrane sensor domain MASE1/ActR/RegA family two-component response regulator
VPARVAPLVSAGVATTVAYVITAQLGFRLAFLADQITTVWAPTGIAIAALLLGGLRLWPAVWAGALLANAFADAPLWTAPAIATGNTLEAVLGTWALRKTRTFELSFRRVASVLTFIGVAAASATAISASVGVTTLCAAGVQSWDRFGVLWFDWWLGDALGALIVTPTIVMAAQQSWSQRSAARAGALVVASVVLTHLVFGQLLGVGTRPLEFVIFPAVIAAAVIGGPSLTPLVVLSVSAVAIWHTVGGAGPFAGPDVHQSLVLLQVFMGVLAATAMLLAAAMAERVEANGELRRRVLEQQTLLDVLPIGIGIATDRECRHIRTNRAFAATLGLEPTANASKTAPGPERPTNFRVLTPEGDEVPDDQLPMQVAAREAREIRDLEVDVVHDDGRVIRLLEYAAPLVDEHGRPRGSIGAFVDVTAAHLARTRLARSEERYRRIFDTAGVSLWEKDFSAVKESLDRLRQDGVEITDEYLARHPEFVDECFRRVRVVDVNEATLRMFGADDKRVLFRSLESLLQPQSRESFTGELLALARGQRRYDAEAALRTLDGRPLHVLVSIVFPEPGDSFESVLVSLADITGRTAAEAALRQEVEVRTTLAQVGASLAGELRTDALVQSVTNAATKLTEAEFGAFFYNVTDEKGNSYALYSLSGAPMEAFAHFPHPRATQVFGPTFRGESTIRLDDVTQDPRYGQNLPYRGMPPGHLPVRSYLAVPVVGRGGTVLGGLFFGHSQPAVFTERHEQLAAGVAGWAAIALDNARLYKNVEEANRLKDEFLATLSHELRTPLNAVLGWAHMLREGTIEPGMRKRALESLERNARAQAQLVDDLLDVSRIMAGKLQMKQEDVDLGKVVVNAVDTVRAGVAAKRLNVRLQVPSHERLVVGGDASRLQQIVWNLVSNAVKFTPTDGRIDIQLRHVDSKAEIVVRDTGQGIAPSFQPYLFQRFRQMDASKTRLHGGLGLGLSIVRHLTEAHGGSVTAESAGEGHGATFRVLLPLRGVDHRAADQPVTPDATVDGALAGVRALVVDGDAKAREALGDVLGKRGAHVVAAASAGEALHLLAQQPFDVLIADLAMPEQDGLALVRLVRGLGPDAMNRAIPAIAVTAYAGGPEREQALSAGFQSHLGKPLDPDQLVAAVSTAVDGRRT